MSGPASPAPAIASPIRSRGWPLIFVGTAMSTLAAGSLILLLPLLLEQRGVGEGAIGLIVAAAGVAAFATRLPAGIVYVRRRAARLVVLGSALTTVSFLLIPAARPEGLVAFLVGLDGMAFALTSTTAMAVVVDHRPASMSLASLMGWFTGSIAAGYSLAGFVAGPLSDAIGVAPAMRTMAIVPLIGAGIMWGALRRVEAVGHPDTSPRPRDRRRLRHWLRAMPPGLWIGFLVALYINLVNGALQAFFPIYGVSIGLTLTEVGAVSGIHGALAALVRFGAGRLFARVGFRRVISILVGVSASFVMLLWVPRSFVPIAATFAVIGLARGVLRVASGALAVEGSTHREHGGASGIYLSGLDLGNMLGPLMGGAAAELVGLRAAFPLLGAIFGIAFLLLLHASGRRSMRGAAED